MLVGLACGVDALMLGEYFAGFTESAGPLVEMDVPLNLPMYPELERARVQLKKYWGEGSLEAMNIARYTCPANASKIAKNFAIVVTGEISPGPSVVRVAKLK